MNSNSSLMRQRILTFLLLAFAAVLVTDKSYASEVYGSTNKEYCLIEDCFEKNVIGLQQRLRECRFEQPQHNGITITRKSENNTYRRAHDNTKNGYTSAIHELHINVRYNIVVCHKAVSTSRHTRGYYIYALRHIII